MSSLQDQVGSVLTLTVEAAALNGKTLSRLSDGRVVWLKGVLCIGDQGLFRLTKLKRKSAEAELVDLLKPATQRVEPFCPNIDQCGGCPWQAMPQELQLQTLSEDLDRSLSMATGQTQGTLHWNQSYWSETRAWRHTCRLHLKGRAKTLKIGFYGSEGVFKLDHCPTFTPTLNLTLKEVQNDVMPRLATLDVELDGELRLSTGQHARTGTASFVVKSYLSSAQAHTFEQSLQAWLERSEAVHGIHFSYRLNHQHSLNSRSTRHQKKAKAVSESNSSTAKWIEKSWGTPYNHLGTPHPAKAFMQAHQEGNQALIEEVLKRAQNKHSILELYAGSGNLSIALAEQDPTRNLMCVEGDQMAIDTLKMIAKERGFSKLKTSCLNLKQVPDELLEAFLMGSYQQLILDPPRAGAKELIERLAQLAQEMTSFPSEHHAEITYISCHPAALSRDIHTLVNAGWILKNARLFDLFPHTGHAELCVSLSREGQS